MATESSSVDNTATLDDWPLRPWLLAGIGGLAGLVVHLILESNGESPWGAALAAAIFFAAAASGFVLNPRRWKEAALFCLGLGVVMGGIAWLAVDSGDSVAGKEFAFAAGVFFSLLAIPLFQADFHRKRWATPYAETHFHVWSDAVSAGGALAFVLLSWLLLFLLQALFSLVGFEFIETLIDTNGFGGFFIGVTFGAAMGVLRNQLGIIGTLQRVVMLVFSLLAVPFALAILFFLFVLIATGGSALWDATDSATPVLLACALGCFVLANAVVRDDDEARSDNVVMRYAALALSASILPLTVFAAISMGIRIDQHGLSPERLWALVAIALATAYGLAYWVGLARGRLSNWSHYLRRANLHLAVVSCVIALLLALPILDFGGISARQQVARLNAGEVAVDEFDFAALRWDFGDAGRDALARLAEGDGRVAELAAKAAEMEQRYPMEMRDTSFGEVAIEFDDPQLEQWVRDYVEEYPWACRTKCVVMDLGTKGNRRHVAFLSERNVQHVTFRDDGVPDPPAAPIDPIPDDVDVAPGNVEIREWTGRRFYVDGQPFGEPFE
ncbi:DUF4153 domain-containing protein [Aurantiacibacter rhizosphaerae]|uniref:DUF4153 domain-containing protein n=1 Tax=Aurantiacibacter rhizosphaerae TaxID=2691582 RepID=A0A844XCF4_9SPHN|nr:DUF4153 domain-containing protein [Aurantiacibacter rhizosphaerae]MWV27314.1 DUF4153 domain-containing protein [Aurantiacibacter rhizosphaerae]